MPNIFVIIPTQKCRFGGVFFVTFDSKLNIFVCSLDKTRHLKTSPLPAGKLISRSDDEIHQLQAAFVETIS